MSAWMPEPNSAPLAGAVGASLRQALQRIETAPNRDAIVSALLKFTEPLFKHAAFFVVQKQHVKAWQANWSLPLSSPSVFQTVHRTGAPYFGPLAASAGNTLLLSFFVCEAPRSVLLVPVVVGQKIAGMLYADNGQDPTSLWRAAAVLLVAQRAGVCLGTWWRQHKSMSAVEFDLDMEPPSQETGAQEAALWEAVSVGIDEVNAQAYVAFAEVKDEGSLGDWEDVLVETAESVAETSVTPKPTAVGWDDVLRELSSAAQIKPAPMVDDAAARRLEIEKLRHDAASPNREASAKLLAHRLYDANPENRLLAATALRDFAGTVAYGNVVTASVDELHLPQSEKLVAAAQILGALHEPTATTALIPLLSDPDERVHTAVHSALVEICGVDFGRDVGAWQNWCQEKSQQVGEDIVLT